MSDKILDDEPMVLDDESPNVDIVTEEEFIDSSQVVEEIVLNENVTPSNLPDADVSNHESDQSAMSTSAQASKDQTSGDENKGSTTSGSSVMASLVNEKAMDSEPSSSVNSTSSAPTYYIDEALQVGGFGGHNDPVYALDIAPKLNLCISGGGDDLAYLFRLSDGQRLHKLKGHTDSIVDVAFQPTITQSTKKSKSQKKKAKGKSTSTAAATSTTSPTANATTSSGACSQPKGTICAATAGMDGTVRLWDAMSGDSIRVLSGPSAELEFLRWHQSKPNVLMAGGTDCLVWLWNASNGSSQILAGHEDAVTCGDWVVRRGENGRRGGLAVTGSLDGTMRVWRSQEGTCVHTFRSSFGGDSSSSSKGGSGDVAWHDPGAPIVSLEVHHRDPYVLTGAADGAACLCLVEKGKYKVLQKLQHFVAPHVSENSPMNAEVVCPSIEGIGFCRTQQWCATGCTDGEVCVWDLKTQSIRLRGKHDNDGAAVTSLEWIPDSHQFITGGADGSGRLWDARVGKIVKKYVGSSGCVNTMKFVRQKGKSYVCTGGDDKYVRIFGAELT
eukprot:g98.t1